MPSVESSRRLVSYGVRRAEDATNHEAILANLQAEIDKHNEVKAQLGQTVEEHGHGSRKRKHESDKHRFRFKDGVKDPNGRKRRKQHDHPQRSSAHLMGERHRQQKCSCFRGSQRDESIIRDDASHPFPREAATSMPVDPFIEPERRGADDAFRESLFDALADDEGATYWESVYGDPIHNYFRPVVENEFGLLERMDDDTYADYVKQKMWERKHPELVLEREKKERERLEEERERAKRKEEFYREKERREREWEQYGQWHQSKKDRHPSGVDDEVENPISEDVYVVAWDKYTKDWDTLRLELAGPADTDERSGSLLAAIIPWPVLQGQRVKKEYIEAFMWNVPHAGQTRLDLLKRERVRWHPDKVQQRFGGRRLEEATMKTVTGVFRVIDGLVEEARKRQAPL
ncbi:hypothetical protein K431DRAFT_294922 [Polychaeton citri CBS 116435]|uniref:Uncharacterized protein n=1 Tax=Polychaeton citri CBS 116435 TaxID=1314669 RepID=A0A9P4UPJ8_9PEZI|nr:hypothetical protein K431DRAFT_294922 [Polychaeton citri CBS 116435]